MKTQTKAQIIDFIKANGEARPHDLHAKLGITNAALHRHLKKLCADGVLKKIGASPHVFYTCTKKSSPTTSESKITSEQEKFLEKNYLYISPTGEFLLGFAGFLAWASSIKEEKKITSLVEEYIRIRQEADSHFSSNRIDATERMKDIFGELCLDKVYYQDFYSLPKFGKTKLGQLLLHGKQAQNKKIINEIARGCETLIKNICKAEKINAVAWVPHSLPRKIPFLKELEQQLHLSQPKVEIVKAYSGQVPVAQKTLAKLEDRITNASQTIVVKPTKVDYKNILLIDDAVGSGATMQEAARKLKAKGAKRVIGFAIVGSYKGFEVIREV